MKKILVKISQKTNKKIKKTRSLTCKPKSIILLMDVKILILIMKLSIKKSLQLIKQINKEGKSRDRVKEIKAQESQSII